MYTPEQIKEIILIAKQLGASKIKTEGLEVEFHHQNGQDMVNEKTLVKAPEKKDGDWYCKKHQEDKIDGNWGPWCRSCSDERKSANRNRNRY